MMVLVAGLFHTPDSKTNKGLASSFFTSQKMRNAEKYIPILDSSETIDPVILEYLLAE